MFKKARFPIAITLLVQSIAFFVLFIVLCAKKKSIAGAFLAVSAIEFTAGACLIAQMKKEIANTVVEFDDDFEVDEAAIKADLERAEEEPKAAEIPCDDASEDEFKA